MKKNLLLIFAIGAILSACSTGTPDAEKIIRKSIETHGGELYENSIIEFDFRKFHIILERDNGRYSYHRIFDDSVGTIHDILTNEGFTRLVNDEKVTLDPKWEKRYASSVNSIAYFVLLPFGLDAPAVIKKYEGEENIDGKGYYRIRVTFKPEGGGEDFNDIFMYWINKDNHQMEYFGYYYHTGKGGIRFRKAVNTQRVGGILFSDYINYRGPESMTEVGDLAAAYRDGRLEKVSDIIQKNLKVKRYR